MKLLEGRKNIASSIGSSPRYPPEGEYPEISEGYEIGEKLSPSAWDRILGSRGCRAVSEAPELGRPCKPLEGRHWREDIGFVL